MTDPVLPDPATVELADTLLGLWDQLATRHVALGAACACGIGGVSLRLEDFELDILGFLEDKALRSGEPDIAAFFEAWQCGAGQDQPLPGLLRQARDGLLAPALTAWVLPKLQRTLSSFAELHGGGLMGAGG